MAQRATFRFQAFYISESELNVLTKYGLIDQSAYSRHTVLITPKKTIETLVSLEEKADRVDALGKQVRQVREELDTPQSRSTKISMELAELAAKKVVERLEKILSENEKLKRENAELRDIVRRLEEQKQGQLRDRIV